MTDKITTLVIGLPWYAAPDADTFPDYFDFMLYLGALSERTYLRHAVGAEIFDTLTLPKLSSQPDDPLAEPTAADYDRLGRLQIAICNYSRTSLVGKAREMIAASALNMQADYILWWDADMRFPYSSFLRLWRHEKPIVAALAFTAREPIFPVVFGVQALDRVEGDIGEVYEKSSPLFNYPADTLLGDEHVNGWLATGAGVLLTDVGVFSEIPKPWFNSTGAGEDWFFCARAATHGISRHVDTSLKVQHKAHAPQWCDEDKYWETRRAHPEAYEEMWGKLVMPEDR
jgi:hypothetical protein